MVELKANAARLCEFGLPEIGMSGIDIEPVISDVEFTSSANTVLDCQVLTFNDRVPVNIQLIINQRSILVNRFLWICSESDILIYIRQRG